MALLEVNWKPTRKELRDFGDITLAMLTAIGLYLHWVRGVPVHWTLILAATGLGVYLVSRVWAPAIKPVYLGAYALTWPIGWIVSHLVLGLFYYGILTPLGWIFRLMGRDPLCRKVDPAAGTYWVEHREPECVDRYFRQF